MSHERRVARETHIRHSFGGGCIYTILRGLHEVGKFFRAEFFNVTCVRSVFCVRRAGGVRVRGRDETALARDGRPPRRPLSEYSSA